MKKELGLCGPQTAAILKRTGVKLKTAFYWKSLGKGHYTLVEQSDKRRFFGIDLIPAYGIAELGLMIPWGYFQKSMVHKMPGGVWQVQLIDGHYHSFATEVEARASYLIDLILNKVIAIDEINHPEKYEVVLSSGKIAPVRKSEESE